MKIVEIFITLKGSYHRIAGDFCDNYSYCTKLNEKEELQAILASCRKQITQLENSHAAAIYKELQILNADYQELSTQVVELREEWALIKSFLAKQGIAIENDKPSFSNYALPRLQAELVETKLEDDTPF